MDMSLIFLAFFLFVAASDLESETEYPNYPEAENYEEVESETDEPEYSEPTPEAVQNLSAGSHTSNGFNPFDMRPRKVVPIQKYNPIKVMILPLMTMPPAEKSNDTPTVSAEVEAENRLQAINTRPLIIPPIPQLKIPIKYELLTEKPKERPPMTVENEKENRPEFQILPIRFAPNPMVFGVPRSKDNIKKDSEMEREDETSEEEESTFPTYTYDEEEQIS